MSCLQRTMGECGLMWRCCMSQTFDTVTAAKWNGVHFSSTPTTFISSISFFLVFFLHSRFTEVRTNGNSTWRTGSWIWTGETMSSPKPLGTPSGEVEQKQTKQQEQELSNSFYPVNRHVNILPYPVTGLISGNFSRVSKNSGKPKGLWGIVKTWAQWERERKKNETLCWMRDRQWRERPVSRAFFFFQASLPSFLREFTSHTLESECKCHTGLVDQVDLTCHRRSDIIHCRP